MRRDFCKKSLQASAVFGLEFLLGTKPLNGDFPLDKDILYGYNGTKVNFVSDIDAAWITLAYARRYVSPLFNKLYEKYYQHGGRIFGKKFI